MDNYVPSVTQDAAHDVRLAAREVVNELARIPRAHFASVLGRQLQDLYLGFVQVEARRAEARQAYQVARAAGEKVPVYYQWDASEFNAALDAMFEQFDRMPRSHVPLRLTRLLQNLYLAWQRLPRSKPRKTRRRKAR